MPWTINHHLTSELEPGAAARFNDAEERMNRTLSNLPTEHYVQLRLPLDYASSLLLGNIDVGWFIPVVTAETGGPRMHDLDEIPTGLLYT